MANDPKKTLEDVFDEIEKLPAHPQGERHTHTSTGQPLADRFPFREQRERAEAELETDLTLEQRVAALEAKVGELEDRIRTMEPGNQ